MADRSSGLSTLNPPMSGPGTPPAFFITLPTHRDTLRRKYSARRRMLAPMYFLWVRCSIRCWRAINGRGAPTSASVCHGDRDIDPDLKQILLKAVDPNPDNRYPSIEDFHADLAAHLERIWPGKKRGRLMVTVGRHITSDQPLWPQPPAWPPPGQSRSCQIYPPVRGALVDMNRLRTTVGALARSHVVQHLAAPGTVHQHTRIVVSQVLHGRRLTDAIYCPA